MPQVLKTPGGSAAFPTRVENFPEKHTNRSACDAAPRTPLYYNNLHIRLCC